ncbi:MAG: hypothetical protein RL662_2039 [Bacteroidota bacterium]
MVNVDGVWHLLIRVRKFTGNLTQVKFKWASKFGIFDSIYKIFGHSKKTYIPGKLNAD